jgi:ribosomal protein S12 methylthiotransferase
MKIYFVSLGCDKNLVDSEKMLGELSEHGYEFTDDEETADIAAVNTCCFIHDAQQESVDTILELAERRKSGKLKALIVTGCLAQRYQKDIVQEIPEVDAVLGTTAIDEIVRAVDAVLQENQPGKEGREGCNAAGKTGNIGMIGDPVRKVHLEDLSRPEHGGQKRILTTPGAVGYLKIAEGCDKHCTYCVIPSVRGPYRSVPMEELLQEASSLAAQGVKELILVAQETTVYGVDLYGRKRLPDLLKKLCAIDGIEWIRILYCYPEEITDELIETIADEPKILHYLDMPIQHASDAILKAMGRRTNRAELEEIIARIRSRIPDICLRTTLITGFPGESEQNHRHLLAFVKKMKFDRLGVFTYSKEDGTPAAAMRPQVPARIKKQRQKELMLAQQEIAFRKVGKMKKKQLQAIVEGKLVGEDVYTARTYRDAPGVDGLLFIETPRELMSGDMVNVTVTGSKGYDLTGVLSE